MAEAKPPITDHGFTPWKTAPNRCNTCGKVVGRHERIDVAPPEGAAPAATVPNGTAAAPPATPRATRTKRAPVSEEGAWQTWALKLTDMAPKGTTVGWLGDYKYAVIFGDGPCYVVVKVSQYDADEATYTVEDCPAGNGQHPTLEAAMAAAQRKH